MGDLLDADQISEDLRRGGLRAVYHGSAHRAALKELARTTETAVEDTTRTMLRLKALFRARAIRTPGHDVYQPESRAEWLTELAERGARFRAESLSRQLDVLKQIRQQAKPPRRTRRSVRRAQGPVSRLEPWFAPVRPKTLSPLSDGTELEPELMHAEEDEPADPEAPHDLARGGRYQRADRQGAELRTIR